MSLPRPRANHGLPLERFALARTGGGGLITGTGAFAATDEVLFIACLEIGLIPATALKSKSSSGDFLLQRGLTALWTVEERSVTYLLQRLQLFMTRLALVLIRFTYDFAV